MNHQDSFDARQSSLRKAVNAVSASRHCNIWGPAQFTALVESAKSKDRGAVSGSPEEKAAYEQLRNWRGGTHDCLQCAKVSLR